LNFRRAVSAAIDRQGIVRLVYDGRAAPIWTHVTPGNKLWMAPGITRSPRSVETARTLLKSSGFAWNGDGRLVDQAGRPIEFSILTNAGNSERAQMATMIQQDLAEIGIAVRIVSLEFRSLLDRVTNTLDYEACLLGLASGDVDPASEMSAWPSAGSLHLWEMRRAQASTTGWQAEVDRLMALQLRETDQGKRKDQYDRVQQLIAENLPVIPIVSPDVLVGTKVNLGNFKPAVLLPYVLWNGDELYWKLP